MKKGEKPEGLNFISLFSYMFGFHDMSSQNVRILRMMKNGKAMTNIELSRKIGWRFGARLHELRKAGCIFEKSVEGKKFDPKYKEFWKLISIPDYIHFESTNKIVNEKAKYLKPLKIETVGKA